MKVPYPKVAELALTLLPQGKVSVNRNDITLAGAVIDLLEGIASGKLVVGEPVKEDAAQPPGEPQA